MPEGEVLLDELGDLFGDLLFSPSGDIDGEDTFPPLLVVFRRTLVSKCLNLKKGSALFANYEYLRQLSRTLLLCKKVQQNNQNIKIILKLTSLSVNSRRKNQLMLLLSIIICLLFSLQGHKMTIGNGCHLTYNKVHLENLIHHRLNDRPLELKYKYISIVVND